MNTFSCPHCQHPVFFENVRCENCAAVLGYLPETGTMLAFENTDGETWSEAGGTGRKYRACRNYARENVCNWVIHTDAPGDLCQSCGLTQVIPALNKPENRDRWFRLEQAKRRLVYSLNRLRLPLPSRSVDPQKGVAFQFLEDVPHGEHVVTGHDHGLLTFNIVEADDVHREATRTKMHEPYRTLLGHFRHEIGHYYWMVLVKGSPLLDDFRRLFGDERRDYTTALQSYYQGGAPAAWAAQHISAYASSHPWEDWAETWAHYLHVVDGLHTAAQWQVKLQPAKGLGTNVDELAFRNADFEDALLEQGLPLSCFLNCLNRSLGHNDAYPFAIPTPVVEKLAFVHRVVQSAPAASVQTI